MKRRAHFIWTPDQRIDHSAYFRLLNAEPLRRDDGVNRWFMFRKTFSIPALSQHANIKITCDGRYQLFVNNIRVARGPARASPHCMRFDELDISPQLQAGENTLAVLVHTPGIDLAWYETTKGAWNPVFGDGGLYVDLSIECKHKSVSVLSDHSWKCDEALAWNRKAPRSGWGQDFIEDVDARLIPESWQSPDFDDSQWPSAQSMVSTGSAAEIATGRGGHEPFPTLLRRDIPQLNEYATSPERVVWAQAVIARPNLSLDQQLYNEQLCEPPEGMFESIDSLLDADSRAAVIRTPGENDAAIMLAFSPCITGHPFIEIEAVGGEIIEIAAADSIPGEFTGDDHCLDGLRRPDHLTGAHMFRYRARPGWQRFEKFEWTAVRGLQITVRNAPDGLRIHRIGVTATNYPAAFDGAFSCSDSLLTDLWRVGRHTALQCMHDAFEDCPGREKRQWVGDGVVHFDIAAAAFGPSTYPLGRQFLRHAAESQRPDGLLQMFAPGDHRGDGVVIPDFSLHWVRGLANYWLTTGDDELAVELFPTAEKVLQWFSRHQDEHSLLTNIPFWHFIEWAHIDRGGESLPINALFASALRSAAQLATAIGYCGGQKRYLNMYEKVAAALNERHWNERRGAYVDSVDPQSARQGVRISQQANALIIAFDIAPRDRWTRIVDTITDENSLKFTAAPPIVVNAPVFEEAHDTVRANTFYCHFLYEALAMAGRFDLALAHMRDYYRPMLEAGATTLWESFEPSASLCHVFSATPVYQLSRHSLGVQAIDAGFRRVSIAPQFGDIEWANGTYATPLGAIDVKWQRDGGTILLEADIPALIEIEIVPPLTHPTVQQDISRDHERCRLRVKFR